MQRVERALLFSIVITVIGHLVGNERRDLYKMNVSILPVKRVVFG